MSWMARWPDVPWSKNALAKDARNPFVTGPPRKSDSVMTGLHFGTSVLQRMAVVWHNLQQRNVAERVRGTRHDLAQRPAARRLLVAKATGRTDQSHKGYW